MSRSSQALSKHNCYNSRSRCDGFTLAELLVIVVLLGISVSLGFRGFGSLMQRERLRIAAAQTSEFLESARNAAISHSVNCLVNISATGVISASESPQNLSQNRCIEGLEDGGLTLNLRDHTEDNSITISPETSGLASGTQPGFSFKGTALTTNNTEIVISSNKTSGFSYCVLITSPLGFIREGKKTSAATSCKYI